MIENIIQLFLELDKALAIVVQTYGAWVYLLLFLVIFIETGLVVMPFLPGDSLLFAAGAIAALGEINVILLFVLLAFAAILGDTVNYWAGKFLGLRIVNQRYQRYIHKTEEFYKRYGGRTIIIARFMPFVRTFAPFIAGVGKMNYLRFLVFNIIGGVLWTGLFIFTGFFFGNLEFVKDNFSLMILIIIFISLLPMIIEIIRNKLKRQK